MVNHGESENFGLDCNVYYNLNQKPKLRNRQHVSTVSNHLAIQDFERIQNPSEQSLQIIYQNEITKGCHPTHPKSGVEDLGSSEVEIIDAEAGLAWLDVCRKNHQKHICPYKANGNDVHILRSILRRI